MHFTTPSKCLKMLNFAYLKGLSSLELKCAS